MKRIKLTQGQYALVDDWNYKELSEYNWFAHWDNHTKSYYAQTTLWENENTKTTGMHRFIMKTPKDKLCDHRNHNTLDNQEHNLRNVTHAQNTMNSRTRSDNSLNERCICRRYSKFLVQVRKQGKRFYKTFSTLDDAIQVRNVVLKEFHEDYAYMGEPQ